MRNMIVHGRASAAEHLKVALAKQLHLLRALLLGASLLCSLLCPVALADEADESDNNGQEPEQWQEVEVIIFRQWERGGRHDELWPTRADDPYYPLWQIPAGCEAGQSAPVAPGTELVSNPEHESQEYLTNNNQTDQDQTGVIGSAPPDNKLPTFICLPEDRRQLDDEWAKINSSGDYSQVYYAAWLQPQLSKEESIAIPIPYHWQPHSQPLSDQQPTSPGAAEPHPIEPVYGLVRVFTKRFIHAVVDIRMHRTASGAQVAEHELLRAPLHVMHQSRRMRGNDLHYLDHPALGVLIVVRPIDKPNKATAGQVEE